MNLFMDFELGEIEEIKHMVQLTDPRNSNVDFDDFGSWSQEVIDFWEVVESPKKLSTSNKETKKSSTSFGDDHY